MADTVTSEYVFDGERRKVLHLTSTSDGTGESGVVKIDVSALGFDEGRTPNHVAVDMVDYAIQGINYVELVFDATADDELCVLPEGQGTVHFGSFGGKSDPQSAGSTGDVKLSTSGAASGGSYDIVVYFRPKSN